MWVSQQGCPTISHGRDPPHVWSTQMAPGKHVLCNLQSSGARPWKSKPVPVEGPSLPRAPPPSTSGAPGQLAGRAQQSASASMHLLGSPAGVGRVRRPITGLCEHVLGFCFFFLATPVDTGPKSPHQPRSGSTHLVEGLSPHQVRFQTLKTTPEARNCSCSHLCQGNLGLREVKQPVQSHTAFSSRPGTPAEQVSPRHTLPGFRSKGLGRARGPHHSYRAGLQHRIS